jgi:hypothetical protein
MLKLVYVVAMSCILGSGTVLALDWSTCASDLDRLRRAANDASSAASDVDSNQRRFNSAKENLERCLRYPQIYDLMRDQCQSKRFESETALADLRTRISTLRNWMSELDSRARSVSSSCGSDISVESAPPISLPPGTDERCAIYLRYKNRLPISTLLQLCSQNQPENECRKCLGIN